MDLYPGFRFLPIPYPKTATTTIARESCAIFSALSFVSIFGSRGCMHRRVFIKKPGYLLSAMHRILSFSKER
jgi:hypothetical protein